MSGWVDKWAGRTTRGPVGMYGGGVETLHLVPHHGPLLLINKVSNEHFDTLGNFLKACNSDRMRIKAENKDDIICSTT